MTVKRRGGERVFTKEKYPSENCIDEIQKPEICLDSRSEWLIGKNGPNFIATAMARPYRGDMKSETYVNASDPDFLDVLHEIVHCETLSRAVEGISRKVLDGGYSDLTGKQLYVFHTYVVEQHMADPSECIRCGCEIPWRPNSDRRNDGLCNLCWEGLTER